MISQGISLISQLYVEFQWLVEKAMSLIEGNVIQQPRHCVVIREGRILAVCPVQDATEAGLVVEHHSGCLMPGLIDAHALWIASAFCQKHLLSSKLCHTHHLTTTRLSCLISALSLLVLWGLAITQRETTKHWQRHLESGISACGSVGVAFCTLRFTLSSASTSHCTINLSSPRLS